MPDDTSFSTIDGHFFEMILDISANTQLLLKVLAVIGSNVNLSKTEQDTLAQIIDSFNEKQQAIVLAAKQIAAIVEKKTTL